MNTSIVTTRSTGLSPRLQKTFATAAMQFTQGILDAIRSAPLTEIFTYEDAPKAITVSDTTGKAPRKRRSALSLDKTLDRVAALLQAHPKGLKFEDIRFALKLSKKVLVLPIARGLANGTLSKTGRKRGTVYTVK